MMRNFPIDRFDREETAIAYNLKGVKRIAPLEVDVAA
jgi:hypothetical protein